MSEADIVRISYDENSEREWNRLAGFRFEFEITKRYLRKYLKGRRILDIGGGPGRYSLYLAALGYDVTLVDLSEKCVNLAKEKAAELGLQIDAFACDARELSKLSLGRFDSILLMGPLYHLFSEDDRGKCVREAAKYLEKDGVLFASFISLPAGLNYYLANCPSEIIHETALDYFDCLEAGRAWAGRAFTDAVFVPASDIEPFFAELGFSKLALFGQEGVAGVALPDIESASEEVRQKYLEISLQLCEKEQYFTYSHHLMYVGTRKAIG